MDFSGNDNNKELFSIFQTETEEILDRLFNDFDTLDTTPANKDVIFSTYRDLHSIKGAVRMVGFNNIQSIFHKMEDIFDAVNNGKFLLTKEIIDVMARTLGIAAKYLQESIKNEREIIDDAFTATISNLEYIFETEINEQKFRENEAIINTDNAENLDNSSLSEHQVEINASFNNCFEIIDSIVPEEESQDTILLKEEVQKIYEFFKDSNLYEVKTSLENILTKIEFVMNATNTLTISEILELRNELSSAAAKFTTSCIETEESGTTFFDIAEKISMLQGSSIHAKEIKEDILHLKESVDDQNILELIAIIIEILDFISDNSVQLEEQMVLTLKSAVEYCASPNESIDSELILQQLEIMKQLLELNYKKLHCILF